MAIKHATIASGLTGGARIGQPDWDAAHVVEPNTIPFADLAAKPTTLSGYGITDAAVLAWLRPAAGEYIHTSINADGSSGIGSAADLCEIYQWVPPQNIVATGLAIIVNGAVLSSNAKVVVYSSDANGRPNSLIYESGNIDCSTVGVKTVALSLTFSKGVTYWIGLRTSSSQSINGWGTGLVPPIHGGTVQAGSKAVLRRFITFASAAPSLWGWSSSEIQSGGRQPFAIWFKE